MENRRTILSLLKNHPEGLTITSIAALSKLHRHTVTKYMYELRGAEMVVERVIGPAKLFYLRAGLSSDQKGNILGRLNGAMKSTARLGQVQVLAVLLFLFLVPTTIIIAQNATNFSENLSVPASGWTVAANDGTTGDFNHSAFLENLTNSSNPTNMTNGTGSGVITIPEFDPVIIGNGTGNQTPENETAINESGGNQTEPSNNTQDNVSLPFNESEGNQTIPPDETQNVTFPSDETDASPSNETNATVPSNETNETVIIPEPPVLEIRIDSPERITRGEKFQATGRVISRGLLPVRDVELVWRLPEGFEIVSGDLVRECGDIGKDEECVSVIGVSTDLSALTGDEELEVYAYYG